MKINFNIDNLWVLIISGLIIGSITGRILRTSVIKTYHGPNAKEITKQIYSDGNGNYYQYITRIVPCPI